MFQVMIVDDKKNIIEGMQKLIPWEAYGYQIVAMVRSGQKAIEVLEQQHIDLCITDIRMPGMSGLELIDHAKRNYPHTKFVILSGYDEFTYAKQALEYQVCGYLLKPVDEEELIAILIRLKEEIEEQKEFVKQTFWRKVQSALSNESGEMDEEDVAKDLRYVSITLKKEELEDDEISHHDAEMFVSYFRELEELLGRQSFEYIVKRANQRELMLDLSMLNGGLSEFICLLQSLQENCREKMIVLVGQKTEKLSDCKKSRKSVEKLADVMFYHPEQSIFCYDKDREYVFAEYISDNELQTLCVHAVKAKEESKVIASVESLFEQIKKEKIQAQSVFRYLYHIILSVSNTVTKSGGDGSNCLHQWSLVEQLPVPDVETVKKFFLEIMLTATRVIQEVESKNLLGIVGAMLTYVDENYNDENLNLQWLSQKYHTTPSYLGRAFKQRYQMSFNKYLTKLRIEKAKELLKNTDCKVYEIAQMVGYSDSNYFHVKFTDVEKITPAKYREMVTNKHAENKEEE